VDCQLGHLLQGGLLKAAAANLCSVGSFQLHVLVALVRLFGLMC
jgi:hypothetical protein